MKTKLSLMLFLISGGLVANPIDSTLAKTVAENYYMRISQTQVQNISLSYIEKVGNTPIYFVYNINLNDGYVIVSADDAAIPILAYCIKGHYVSYNLTPAFMYWMNGYKQEILNIKTNNITATQDIQNKWQEYENILKNNNILFLPDPNPLMTTTWNQDCYYNSACPYDASGPCNHAYAGCPANAMAQIMKYYNWPATGTSSWSYNDTINYDQNNNPIPGSSYGLQSANFGATAYDWYNMPTSLNSGSTSTQINAISTLMKHCGVSVEMNYGPLGSGAFVISYDFQGSHSASSEHAFPTFFNYSPSIEGYERSTFPNDATWIGILTNELDHNRPIQYAGWDSAHNAAHTWVCDGYNTSNYFHMNWGGSDSWVTINALNVGIYQFNDHQQALVGIVPNCSDLISVSQSLSTYSTTAGSTIVAYCAEKNNGPVAAGANVISVHLSSNNILTPGQNGDTWIGEINIPSVGANLTSSIYSANVQIPAGTAAGTYYVFFSADGGQAITEFNELNNFATQQITVTTGGGCTITSTTPTLVSPGTLSSPGPIVSTLTPTLTWNAVPGANNYDVFIRKDPPTGTLYTYNCVGNVTSYTVPAGVLVNGGYYRWNMQANVNCGTCESNYATSLYFQITGGCTSVSITSQNQPQNQTAMVGSTATFTVTPSGTSPFLYFWYKNGIQITGANSASFTTPTLTISNDGDYYYCIIINCNNQSQVQSSNAYLTVNTTCTAVSISSQNQPQDQTAMVGSTATFTVTPSGTSPFLYFWYKNGIQITGANIASYTTPTLTISNDGDYYYCIIINCSNQSQAISSNAYLTVTNGSGLADLTIHINSYTPTTINPGTLVHVNYTRENIGSVNAPNNKIGIYISSDNIFNPNTDEFLDDWSQGSTNSGSGYTGTLNFDISNCYACGTYYIFLFIDYQDVINESDESNNYDSFQIQITGCTTCSYSVPPTGINFQSAGGSGNFNVTTSQCCEWNATTSDSWITIMNDFGYGTSVINYAVVPCSGGGTRTGTIYVEGQAHTITQNCTQACNNSNSFEWGVQAGSTTLSDEASDVAIDASGNLFMTGDIQGAADFGGGIILTTPSTAPDIFVSKHDSSGVIQWAVNFGDTDQEEGSGIATDNSGNIYVIGISANDITFGSSTLTANGTNEGIAFLIKLNSSGILQWAKKINVSFDGRANDIVIDNNNNIFIVGSLSDYTGGTGDGLFISKYNTSGTQIWYNTYGFSVSYVRDAYGIAVDNLGNLLMSGRYMHSITLGSTTLTSSTVLDIDGFITKLNSNGNVIWANQLTSPGQSQDALMSVAVDASNNIYTVGHVDSTAIVGSIIIPLPIGDKEIIIKYDQNGNPVWAKASDEGWANNGQRIVLGNDNNIYIAGCYAGSMQLDSITITGFGSNDGFIGCLDTSGTIKWLKGFGSTQAEGANGIVLNSANDVFVAGGFRGTVIFGSTTLTSTGSTDIYLAKFKQCDPPITNITYLGSFAICPGETKSFSTEYCSSFSYQWLLNNVNISGATSSSYNASQAGSYNVLVTASAGCETMSNAVILTNNTITSPTITGDNVLCEPVTTTLLNAGSGYTTYTWSNGSSTQSINVGTGTYTVAVTNSAGCIASSSIDVTLNQNPIIEAGNDTSISQGNSLIIGGNPTAIGNAPFIFSWIPTTGLNSDSVPNPIASPQTTTTYTVTVIDRYGCSNLDTIVITVGPGGISEIGAINNIIIFPNPTNDLLIVTGSKIENGEYCFELRNILGQLMFADKLKVSNHSMQKQFSLSELAAGMYFLIIENEKTRTVTKLQKMNR